MCYNGSELATRYECRKPLTESDLRQTPFTDSSRLMTVQLAISLLQGVIKAIGFK